jgi:Methyltransferase domain
MFAMAFTNVVSALNRYLLKHFGAELNSLTRKRIESARLADLVAKGQFRGPAYPVPASFSNCNPEPVVIALKNNAQNLAKFHDIATAPEGYDPANPYFTTPDLEVLYVMLGMQKPRRWVEVGSGNSTIIARQAIKDFGLSTKIVSIDPSPRSDVKKLVDQQFLSRLEDTDLTFFDGFEKDDVLFIDSSHELHVGNDVATLFLKVIPKLPSGVIIHIHDIFLPYEYPEKWIVEAQWTWNEQQLVQAMLYFSDRFEVLWPGHYLQKTRTDFTELFPNLGKNQAQSLWLRIN